MDDLVAFAAREDVSAIAQAAIVHAQFEGIHPYADGNGRVGRTLVHVVLRRRGLSQRVVPPISTVLAANRDVYINSLAKYQADGEVSQWVAHFARTTTESVWRAEHLSGDITAMVAEWQSRLGTRRLGSVDNGLVEVLVQRPILSPRTAAQALHVTEETARNALARFESAGVVRQITDGRRNRFWAAEEVFDLLDRFELDVATDDDGKTVAPTRHLRPGL